MLVASPALAASWETITDYGGATNMVIYVPDEVDESPGIAVALHSCGNQYEGDSQNYFRSSADEHGFIIIAPTNGSPDCWNANAGQDGEKPDIVRMVEWVIENHDADPSRVYVGGASSGACMTAAMLATHPDVFAGGTMMAGVPYGAWSGGGSCGVCSAAATPMSEQAWGDVVRSNAPQGFAGPWPRLQIWHGDADTTLRYEWATETEKQWKNLLGLSGEGTMVTGPSGWNRFQYEDGDTVVLQVNRGPGKDHYLPDDIPQEEMIAFFGLDQDAPVGSEETTGASETGSDDDTSGGDTSEGDATTDAEATSVADTTEEDDDGSTTGADTGDSGSETTSDDEDTAPAEEDEDEGADEEEGEEEDDGSGEDEDASSDDEGASSEGDDGGGSSDGGGGKGGCSVGRPGARSSELAPALLGLGVLGFIRRRRRR